MLLGTFVCFWELQVAPGQLLWELLSASGSFCVLLGSVRASVGASGASGSSCELLGSIYVSLVSHSMFNVYA